MEPSPQSNRETQMSGQILVEAYPLDILGLDAPVFHVYLVHRDTNGAERVLRAGPSNEVPIFGATMEVEVNARIAASSDARGGESPEDRLSREITLPTLSTDEAWSLMVRYASTIADADYPYHLLDQNSNSFVGALLAAAGGDPVLLLPLGLDEDEAFGIANYREVLSEIPPPDDGTLFGTEGGERLLGIQVGERIVARAGDDVVLARRGGDEVFCGDGSDVAQGGAGRDRLFGGAGDDTLEDGRGSDVMRGGDGADVFVLTADLRTDVIADFVAGEDLVDLSQTGVQQFEELEITSSSRGYRLALEGVNLAVMVTESAPGADDFLFA